MDVFLSVLSVAGIILGAVLLIMIISLLLSAILYESVCGKRFEIYDSAHLPDLNDYKGLVNEPVTFPSKRGYKYTGFYYHDESYDSFRGLIVFSHGIFDGQLSYLPEIAYFARRGYKIFAFDNSGSHLSGGKSLRGLPQSAEDLDAALSFVTKTNTLPLYLFGHSWGGYAVSAVHCYHLYDIKAVFVQSGFDQTSEMVLEEGSAMMGRWIYILRAYIKLYERMKYGKAAGYTAHAGIAKATANGTKFLILHSTDDKTISLKNSVLANVEKNDNITLITEKNKGHNSLDSDRAIKHKAQLDTLFETTYPKNQRTNKNRRELFSEKVDKQIYYELDGKLMKLIHIRDTAKLLILVSVSFLLCTVEDTFGAAVPFSSLVAVMASGITINRIRPEAAERLSARFGRIWVAAEIVLFVLVGAAVDINYAVSAGISAVILIFAVLLFRMAGVAVCLIKTKIPFKQRLFCCLAYLPKATVQAAIGGVPLAMGLSCGNIVLTVAVLSIIITAPLGAFLIDLTYKKLLD
ncbi:MAG: alpha/beta fold hydrolase [Ruminiclostridium sp.]|nr:alpha/beta fold hydrolase [Ruminiclostridium sp.]